MPREHRARASGKVREATLPHMCTCIRAPDQPLPPRLQVVEQVLRNQGVQASEWGDVEGVVTQCGKRVLETVRLIDFCITQL